MTKHRMKTKYGPDEEPSESSPGCGGVLVLAAATIGLMGATFAISREAFIVLIVVGGWGAIVWAAGRTPKIDNPSPPPPLAPTENEKPQFTVVEDPTNTAHSVVEWGRSQSQGDSS